MRERDERAGGEGQREDGEREREESPERGECELIRILM